MSSTTYAKRKLYKPIDFFYRGVADIKNKKVLFVDAFQILNDRFLGRMNVCNYFFIAENSVRINELNVIALDELKNYHLVMRENFLIPEKVVYNLPITTRFLESDKEFEVLVATLKENGYKKGDLVLSFNSNTVMRIDDEGKKRYDRLRRHGYLTCIYGFGEEFNSLDIFAKLNFDYLRLEASYFDATPAKKRILNMLVKYCSANKIGLIMEGVDNPPQLNRFKREGVKIATGKAVSKLSRYVTNDLLNLPEPKGEKKEVYLKKLRADLEAQAAKEEAEFEVLRLEAIARAKAAAADGKATPVAPRPELMKSPYQVRLEQQKQAAKKAALVREERTAGTVTAPVADKSIESRLIEEARIGIFEGEVQSMMALGAASDEKYKAKIVVGGLTATNDGDTSDASEEKKKGEASKRAKKQELDSSEKQVTADVKAAETKKKSSKKAKNITPDIEGEQRLLNEVRKSSLDDMLSPSTAMGGFGVHLTFEDEDDEPIVGHYNEKGQWIDEDGYIYNGYFDEDGKWHDYETFNPADEGSYNDEGKWVDKDGNVYDGFFDEEGRWIDYTYVDESGAVKDNGYFDEKIGKWIPFGYFDENGIWRQY